MSLIVLYYHLCLSWYIDALYRMYSCIYIYIYAYVPTQNPAHAPGGLGGLSSLDELFRALQGLSVSAVIDLCTHCNVSSFLLLRRICFLYLFHDTISINVHIQEEENEGHPPQAVAAEMQRGIHFHLYSETSAHQL